MFILMNRDKKRKGSMLMQETRIESNLIKYIFKIITIFATILIVAFILYGLKLGILEDKTTLVYEIKKFGILAPIFFICLQLVQVIVPIIPGGASCLAGVLAFGPILGFIYNYIGLTMGSCIVYFLSKKYGLKLIQKIFSKETVNHYLKYIQNNQFSKIFFLGIFLPGLPDDLLCYVAGLSQIPFKTFLIIILLGKPLSLILYSFFMVLL